MELGDSTAKNNSPEAPQEKVELGEEEVKRIEGLYSGLSEEERSQPSRFKDLSKGGGNLDERFPYNNTEDSGKEKSEVEGEEVVEGNKVGGKVEVKGEEAVEGNKVGGKVEVKGEEVIEGNKVGGKVEVAPYENRLDYKQYKKFKEGGVKPTKNTKKTLGGFKVAYRGGFGVVKHPTLPGIKTDHKGVVFDSKPYVPIAPFRSGTVSAIQYFEQSGAYAYHITNEEGVIEVYHNLSPSDVRKGDKVTPDTILGITLKRGQLKYYVAEKNKKYDPDYAYDFSTHEEPSKEEAERMKSHVFVNPLEYNKQLK